VVFTAPSAGLIGRADEPRDLFSGVASDASAIPLE
jgi:hypothetical protein